MIGNSGVFPPWWNWISSAKKYPGFLISFCCVWRRFLCFPPSLAYRPSMTDGCLRDCPEFPPLLLKLGRGGKQREIYLFDVLFLSFVLSRFTPSPPQWMDEWTVDKPNRLRLAEWHGNWNRIRNLWEINRRRGQVLSPEEEDEEDETGVEVKLSMVERTNQSEWVDRDQLRRRRKRKRTEWIPNVIIQYREEGEAEILASCPFLDCQQQRRNTLR